jgi:hypothetical protein
MDKKQLSLLAKINCIIGNRKAAIQAIGRFKKLIPLPTKEELEENPITIIWSGSAYELLGIESFSGVKTTTLVWQAYDAYKKAQDEANAKNDEAINTLTLYVRTFEGKEVNVKSSVPRSQGKKEILASLELVKDEGLRKKFERQLRDYLS